MPEKTKSVSVVIPLYNCPDRIEGAIRSALEQSPRPVEVIVVDDASTDPVDALVLERIDPCVRVIRHEINRGGGAARNTGIDAARGELVAFLDADDRWLPGKLELQVSQMSAREGEDVFACANVRLEGPSPKKLIYNSRPPQPHEDISRYFLIHDCTFQTSTLVVPGRLAKSVRFDDRLRRHQDWDFIFRLIRKGAHYVYWHEPLAIYWDGSADTRVSTQKTIGPALFWLKVAGNTIAPDAAAVFYFRTTFRRHFAEQPVAAFLMALQMGLRDRRSMAWVLRRVVGSLRVP
ncbi:glycosyltransferase family 2 protein [Bradyrhizobium liaoningense]|uniref:glycosyltransferase family 2 protein n=1 Tax=Bradyrhizobium liaoningense TaxID=43992 RepID=UPI001BA782D5|nr:glycosyltransferase family 2 protein [Bradyrhizobium liaoningense]MBR1170993.1 glycosyltransferase family 2 protein [Bradyrhizobium liaoningense]